MDHKGAQTSFVRSRTPNHRGMTQRQNSLSSPKSRMQSCGITRSSDISRATMLRSKNGSRPRFRGNRCRRVGRTMLPERRERGPNAEKMKESERG